jgi:chromosome partitioning protein
MSTSRTVSAVAATRPGRKKPSGAGAGSVVPAPAAPSDGSAVVAPPAKKRTDKRADKSAEKAAEKAAEAPGEGAPTPPRRARAVARVAARVAAPVVPAAPARARGKRAAGGTSSGAAAAPEAAPAPAPVSASPVAAPAAAAARSTRRSGGSGVARAPRAAQSQPAGGVPVSAAAAEADGVGPTGRARVAFPEPAPLDRHGPARILAMCNQKGGVGKTTSTINLGAALAEAGRRVLLVDFDPQGALSVGLGVNPLQLDRTVYNVLMERDVAADDVILKTDVPGMDLLPSNIDLSAAEVQLVNEVAREQTLARALAPVQDDYDIVLVDCQPSLGLLTVNALTAAHGVIIPLECEFFALRGVALLIQTIEKVRERLNAQLEIEGILATMYDARTLHGREVLSRVVEAFGDRVFHSVINRTVRFPETTVAGEPITSYASSSLGAQAYRQLAREVLARTAAAR